MGSRPVELSPFAFGEVNLERDVVVGIRRARRSVHGVHPDESHFSYCRRSVRVAEKIGMAPGWQSVFFGRDVTVYSAENPNGGPRGPF